jgi:peptidoglycan/LPS O-acetylase OafA/YrhL
MALRDLYIDRLRTAMTALVILHHTAITYGGSGGWFYREVETSGHPSSLLLTMFCATNQAYFMGIFFLLAGYFTPASLERKGFARFMGDRYLRLGLPLLGFALLLGPLTVAMVNSAQGGGFWPCIAALWRERAFIYGPLWFAQALLIFSLGYGLWRAFFGLPPIVSQRASNPWSSLGWWLLNIPGIALIIFSIRLLVPLRVIFGPSMVAIKIAFHERGLLPMFVSLWHERDLFTGSLWIAAALLIFILYFLPWRRICGLRKSDPYESGQSQPALPAWPAWLCGALIVGAAAVAIREVAPLDIGLFGFFASYIFLFIVGVKAKSRNWLAQLSWKGARAWIVIACIAWPLLPIGIALAIKQIGLGKANFSGGLTWPAIFYALWEPFVAWGVIAFLLLWFRAHLNQPSAFGTWLGRRAYAVYIIHPPVLVGISLLLHGWAAPALVKFGVVGPLACVACWLAADPLVRLPGVRRVI